MWSCHAFSHHRLIGGDAPSFRARSTVRKLMSLGFCRSSAATSVEFKAKVWKIGNP